MTTSWILPDCPPIAFRPRGVMGTVDGAEVPIRPETTVLEWHEYLDLLALKIRALEEMEDPRVAVRLLKRFLLRQGGWGGGNAEQPVADQIRNPAFLAALDSRGLGPMTFPQQIQDGDLLTGEEAEEAILGELESCLQELGEAPTM